jgi:hypothetical protein
VPATPSLTGQVAINNWHSQISYAKNVVYVSTANNPFTIQAVNVSNPASPTIMSTLFGFGYNAGAASTQVISGKYLLNSASDHFIKVDISNPYNMQIVTNTTLEEYSYGAVSSGRYVYSVAQNGNPGGIDALKIYDISSGTASTLSTTLIRHTPATPYINGRYVYVVGTSYIQVFDIGGTQSQNAQINSASISDINVSNSASFNGDVGIQGGLTLNGQLTASGTALFQNSIDSTTAFQIQNSAQTTLFSVDTTNKRVNIGSSTTDANAVVLVLDSYNSATDPTCVSGGMYYNSSSSQAKVCINGSWTAIGVPTWTSSSLPSSPADGDEIYYRVDRGDGSYGYWHLKYNSATSYWDFLGGPSILTQVVTEETTTSTSYTAAGFTAVSATLPRNGDYDVSVGMRYWNATNTAYGYMSISFAGGAANNNDGIANSGGSSVGDVSARTKRITGLTAGSATAQYKVTGGTGFFSQRWIQVVPLRIQN